MDVSVIIRTLNEGKYLGELLKAVESQDVGELRVEKVLVDSGSTDNTLEIAEQHACVICHISREDFSFGRSLNKGCELASGKILVIVSGHCIPANNRWLGELIRPIQEGAAGYVYGRQVGRDTTKFSEEQLFQRYYPATAIAKERGDFFCNNANSAISKEIWQRYKFDEEVTGLEDLVMAKTYIDDDGAVVYCPEAVVFHIHNESWRHVKIRYEREAIALQKIYPQIHFSLFDFFGYTFKSIVGDLRVAVKERRFIGELPSILLFRTLQYWGTYVGNNDHRVLSGQIKQNYFYPNHKEVKGVDETSGRITSDESAQ